MSSDTKKVVLWIDRGTFKAVQDGMYHSRFPVSVYTEPGTLEDLWIKLYLHPEPARESGERDPIKADFSDPVLYPAQRESGERADPLNDGDGDIRCLCDWQDPMTGELADEYPAVLNPACLIPHKEPAQREPGEEVENDE